MLAPIMPWRGLSHLTHADALAIALPQEPAGGAAQGAGAVRTDEKPGVFVMMVLPGDVYAGLPKPR